VGNEERGFDRELGHSVWLSVRMRRDVRKGLDWAAALSVEEGGRRHLVYLYDNAHAEPERHRYRRGVKQPGELLPSRGSARLDLPAAIEEIKANWEGMVERWER